MPIAQCMSILYRKGYVNEANPVSRRLDFFHTDDAYLHRLDVMIALWWGGNVHDAMMYVIKTMILHC